MAGKSFRVWLYDTISNGEVSETMSYLFDEGVSNARIDLQVPFDQKDQAKLAGARWDNVKRVWYIPPGIEMSRVQQWMGASPSKPVAPQGVRPPVSNVATTQRIDLQVPFDQKDQAKLAGARWDGTNKTWFAPPGTPIAGIKQWMNAQPPQNPNPYNPNAAQPRQPSPTQQPQQKLRPFESPGEPWITGIPVEGNEFGIPATVGKDGKGNVLPYKLIARREAAGTWEVWDEHHRGREGITPEEIKGIIKAIRDPKTNKPVETRFPSIFLRVPDDEVEFFNPETGQFFREEKPKKSRVLDPSKISEEQAAIDQRFAEMVNSKTEDHMTIPALAGTGKTTVLKHLAEKYGEIITKMNPPPPGFQRGSPGSWLYLVFNRANADEAIENKDFPPYVEVNTTNGFLGGVLRNNKAQFPQTAYMGDILKDEEKEAKENGKPSPVRPGEKLEKSTIMADTPQFAQVMDSLGIPDVRRYPNSIGKKYLKNIRKRFQKESLTLVGLAKAYNLDPRVEQDAKAGLELLIEDYVGQVDPDMEVIKDDLTRLSKSDPNYYYKVMNELQQIFGMDFFAKRFDKELIEAVYWLLTQSMPHAFQSQYNHRNNKSYNLGEHRDFVDDLWYTAIHAKDLKWPHYDFVLADEVQDFNENQKVMLDKLAEAGAKIVAVGDVNQCHPAGTKIALTGGREVDIEDIKVGQQVVTYNTKKSYFPGTIAQGRRVEGVASRRYVGELVTIKTESTALDCTPNHKCLVRFKGTNKYCLYLMLKENNVRVGICRLNYFNAFGITRRAAVERADKVWLLNIYDTEYEARIAEVVTATKFGIPQITFMNTGQLSPSQMFIDEVYRRVGDSVDKGKSCVRSFGRMWEFPLWQREEQERHGLLKQNYISSTKSFITQASNLISGCMVVRCFDGTNRGGKWEMVDVSRKEVDCDVYSLKVEPTEGYRRLYIANNQVTHNSMYRFRGADSGAFDNLNAALAKRSSSGDISRPLTMNFRSRPAVINQSNQGTHVKNLRGREYPDKYAGIAREGKDSYDSIFDRLKWEQNKFGHRKQTAMIARTNEPLVHAALKLMGEGVPFVILGRDISGSLMNHIYKIKGMKQEYGLYDESPISELSGAMQSYYEQEKETFGHVRAKDAELKELKEVTEALVSAMGQYRSDWEAENQGATPQDQYTYGGVKKPEPTIKEFETWIRSKLGGLNVAGEGASWKDKKEYKKRLKEQNPVTLTTAHKSKGLEFERTYILRADQFPLKKALKNPKDLKQEFNSKYVSGTRPKNDIIFPTLEDQPGYEHNEEDYI